MEARFNATGRPPWITFTMLAKLRGQKSRLLSSFIAETDKDSTRTAILHFIPAEPSLTCTILFHGMGNDAIFGWEDLILSLLKTGRSVLCFDLAGHGFLSTTTLTAPNFWQCAGFIPHYLAESQPKIQRLEAIAYSLGTLLAARLACEQRILWQKIVLLAPPERIAINLPFISCELLSLLSFDYWLQLWRYGWRARIPAFANVRRKAFPIRQQAGEARPYPQLVQDLLNEWSPLQHISTLGVPALLVFGSADRLTRPKYIKKFITHLPEKELLVIPMMNHFLLPMNQSVHSKILDFLLS